MTQSRLTLTISEDPFRLTEAERSQATRLAVPSSSALGCCKKLEIGFFFDGTRNNLKYDERAATHSNVARLYQSFDEELQIQMIMPGPFSYACIHQVTE